MESVSGSFSGDFQLEYQEEMLIAASSGKKLSIGVPKEDFISERRIALTPNTVKLLTDNGIEVFIESGAGDSAFLSDIEFSESGAEIVSQQEEVFKSDVIVKISPPTSTQISFLQKNQVLISSLNIKTLEKPLLKQLQKKRITAIAIEYIKDEFGDFPFVHFMSKISGQIAINIASNFLIEKKGKLLGGIGGHKPSEIIIIGAGDIARSAVESAIEVGALVKVFDNSIARLRELEESVSTRIYTSVMYPSVLKKEIPRADVLIGALSNHSENDCSLISKDMISSLKKGSLVIDLSIDQGSCFENAILTSLKKPMIEKAGISYYGVANVPSVVPRTASYVLSNIFLQQFRNLQDYNSINHFLKNDLDFRNGLYLYNGVLVNKRIGEIFDLPSQDLNLILAAF